MEANSLINSMAENVLRLGNECRALADENARLKAEVERLRKAGDGLDDALQTYFELLPTLINEVRAKAMLKGRKASRAWLAAKEGKQS